MAKNRHAQILGRKGGKKKSERKARSSRENGKLGGDPRKKRLTAADAIDLQLKTFPPAGFTPQCEKALGEPPEFPALVQEKLTERLNPDLEPDFEDQLEAEEAAGKEWVQRKTAERQALKVRSQPTRCRHGLLFCLMCRRNRGAR